MNDATPHGPPIKFPPPLLFLLGFLAGVAWRSVVPGDMFPPVLAPYARSFGILLMLGGFALSMSGVGTFFRAKTTTLPHRAASKLVVHGPYRYTRNPMYVGITSVYVGSALALNRLWPLAILPFLIVILVRAVVRIEERYLEERFGDDYRGYRARVRRFL
jgi:protein-S-isoprenylcysteine O-methyltransferase Ste14